MQHRTRERVFGLRNSKPNSLGAHDVEGGRHAVAPRSAHGRCSVPVLSAVILAACVAAAGAVAPSEEWAERFRLLEAHFEQSEASLDERVAFLEGERPGAATAAEQGASRGHGAIKPRLLRRRCGRAWRPSGQWASQRRWVGGSVRPPAAAGQQTTHAARFRPTASSGARMCTNTSRARRPRTSGLDFSGSDLWPQPSSWFDYPGLTHTPTLTKTSTVLLVHYQIAFGMGANDDKSQNYLK